MLTGTQRPLVDCAMLSRKMDGGPPRVEKAGIYVDFKFPSAYQQNCLDQ